MAIAIVFLSHVNHDAKVGFSATKGPTRIPKTRRPTPIILAPLINIAGPPDMHIQAHKNGDRDCNRNGKCAPGTVMHGIDNRNG